MATGNEAQPNTQNTTQPAAATPPTESPKAEPAKATPAAATTQAATPPAAAAPPPEPSKAPAERVPTRKLIGDDDDIPDDADLIEMSPKKLKGRLERYSKKQLRDRFGTDDPDDIKARLDKLAEFEEKQEKDRQAQLSETERLKEQLANSERLRVDAEKRVERAQLQRVLENEDRRATRILAKYVDEDDIDDVVPKLARHINRLSDDDLANPDSVIEEWAKDFVVKRPKFAKASVLEQQAKDAAAKEKESKEKVRVPLSTGPAVTKPGTPVQGGGDKTAAPGRPNSMSDAEWREYRKQNGIAY